MVSRTPEQADLTCIRKVALAGQGSRAGEWGGAAEGGAAGRGGATEQAPSFCPFALVSLEHGL